MSQSHVVVFARSPVLGAVKTRLARTIGETRALELYRWLGRRVIEALDRRGRDYRLTVAFTPAGDGAAVRDWLPGADGYEAQCAGDLGQRMANAIDTHLAMGARDVIIVGTDCAAVDAERVSSAIDALGRVACVLGPAVDGGYYLVGARHGLPVFSEMPWSTERVLAESRRRLRAHAIAWEELAIERDIDTAGDLVALRDCPEAPDWLKTSTDTT